MNSDVAIEIKNVSKSFRIEIEDKEKQGGLFSKRTTKIIAKTDFFISRSPLYF